MNESPGKTVKTLLVDGGAKHLDNLCVLYLEGDDALDWLQGQVTQDLRDLEEDTASYALILQRNGRILTDLWVSKAEDKVRIVAPKTQRDALKNRVEEHVIMEDVELEESDEQVFAVLGNLHLPSATQAEAISSSKTDRLGVGGRDFFVSSEAIDAFQSKLAKHCEEMNAVWLNEDAWALAHLHLKRARFGIDFDQHHLPQEAGLAKGAVSFEKGCYLGQEAVVMLEHRGKLSRRLAALRGPSSSSVQPQQSIHYEGQEVGNIAAMAIDENAGIMRMSAWLQTKKISVSSQPQHTVKLMNQNGCSLDFLGFYGAED